MLNFKESYTVPLANKKTKKIKGAPYFCKELNRELFVHPNVDNDKHTSVSDKITGYRLFNFPEKYDKIKEEQVAEKLAEYIKHYSIPAIEQEFQRVESLMLR